MSRPTNSLGMLLILALLMVISSDQAYGQQQALTDTRYGVFVLGIAQDAGIPQTGCNKKCCFPHYYSDAEPRYVSCLAVVDRIEQKYWLIDATPDIKYQLQDINDHLGNSEKVLPEAIFLTHAHIGHYTGLMDLGKEVMGAREVPVYAMPRMKSFLEKNGPWSQLADQNNITLVGMNESESIKLDAPISIEPFKVPHRDEFSETVGYKIIGPNRSIIFIPDIDKWHKWNKDIKGISNELRCCFPGWKLSFQIMNCPAGI